MCHPHDQGTLLSMQDVTIIYASTSGHTEYVISRLVVFFASALPAMQVRRVLAEKATPEDIEGAKVLVLGSGTWNTGGVEGQLNPHMDELLRRRAAEVKLEGKPCTMIALGDDRYYYTARAGEHMRSYIVNHGGKIFCDPLTIINDPFGQEERVEKWGKKFLAALQQSST
jgi:flavodoxin